MNNKSSIAQSRVHVKRFPNFFRFFQPLLPVGRILAVTLLHSGLFTRFAAFGALDFPQDEERRNEEEQQADDGGDQNQQNDEKDVCVGSTVSIVVCSGMPDSSTIFWDGSSGFGV